MQVIVSNSSLIKFNSQPLVHLAFELPSTTTQYGQRLFSPDPAYLYLHISQPLVLIV
jgi:hypothetical protein